MARLQDEVAGLVLSRLTDASDVVRCSVVCRTWSGLLKRTHLKAIEMWHREAHGDDEEAQAQLRWLQGLQNDGCLKHLQEAVLIEHPDLETDPGELSTLSQGFIVMAGCWPLHTTVLSGPFSYSHAVALLPNCLVELELWPYSLPGGSVRLSQFQKYTSLRKLKVAAGDGSPVDQNYSGAAEFLVDTALSALQFLSARDKLICNVTAGHSFAELLPSVQHACLNLRASVDGLILAQSIMVSQTMCKLELYLIESDGPSTTLQVPKSSHLRS